MKNKKPNFVRFGGLNPVKQEGYDPRMEFFHSPPAKKGIYAFVENHLEFFLLGGKMSAYGAKHSKYKSLKDREGNKIKISSKVYDLINKHSKEMQEISERIGLGVSSFSSDEDKRNKLIEELMKCPYFSKWAEKQDLSVFTDKDYDNWESWLKKEVKRVSGSASFIYHHIEKEDKYLLIKLVDMKKFTHKGDLWHHLDPTGVSGVSIIAQKGGWYKTSYEDYCKLFQKEFSKVKKRWVNHSEGFADKDFWWGKTSYDHLEVFIEKITT